MTRLQGATLVMAQALSAALLAAVVASCGSDASTDDTQSTTDAGGEQDTDGKTTTAAPSDEQLLPAIKQWAEGDDTGNGRLACSALTVDRAEQERREAQEDGNQFATCEEMYEDDPPYYPKGELVEYDVEQRTPTVAVVRAVFEGGGSGGSVYEFGLRPVEGSWLIADREEITD